MHYAIIIRDGAKDEPYFLDGAICDLDGIKRYLGKSTPHDAEVITFDLRDLMGDDIVSSCRRVTEDVVREAYHEGALDREDEIVRRFLGAPVHRSLAEMMVHDREMYA